MEEKSNECKRQSEGFWPASFSSYQSGCRLHWRVHFVKIHWTIHILLLYINKTIYLGRQQTKERSKDPSPRKPKESHRVLRLLSALLFLLWFLWNLTVFSTLVLWDTFPIIPPPIFFSYKLPKQNLKVFPQFGTFWGKK